jgi:hypothetical protein
MANDDSFTTELNFRIEPSRDESYVTTDEQWACLSWNKAPNWDLRPDLYYCQRGTGLLMSGALSLTRGSVCRLQLLLILASTVILGSESRGIRNHISLSQIRDFQFRHLLRLAGLRRRCSTPPKHDSLRMKYVSFYDRSGPRIEHTLERFFC